MSTDYGKLEENRKDRDRLLEMLMDMRWHTPAEMRRAGGVRHSARLLELKRLGYKIDDRPMTGKEQGKQYILVSLVPGTPQKKRAKVLLDEADLTTIVGCQSMVDLLSTEGVRELRRALIRYRSNKDKL
jgi:hypothetical protein